MSFLQHIEDHRQLFLKRASNPEWNNLVTECNNNVTKANARFCPGSPPSFFAGKLFKFDSSGNLVLNRDLKVVLITMNPMKMYEYDVNRDPDMFQRESLNDFIRRQMNWFEPTAENRTTSTVFNRCIKLGNAIVGVEQEHIDDRVAIVDWFPFYSSEFKINKNNNLPHRYLTTILNGLSGEIPEALFIAISKPSVDLLIELSAKSNLVKQYGEKNKSSLIKHSLNGKHIYSFPIGYRGDEAMKWVAKNILTESVV